MARYAPIMCMREMARQTVGRTTAFLVAALAGSFVVSCQANPTGPTPRPSATTGTAQWAEWSGSLLTLHMITATIGWGEAFEPRLTPGPLVKRLVLRTARVCAVVQGRSGRSCRRVAARHEMHGGMHRGHRQRVDARVRETRLPPRRSIGADVYPIVCAGGNEGEGEAERAHVSAIQPGHLSPLRAPINAEQRTGSARAGEGKLAGEGAERDRRHGGTSRMNTRPCRTAVGRPQQRARRVAGDQNLIVGGIDREREDWLLPLLD